MTELIWDGKYDKNARKVAPLRVSLPFQTVETVNESAQERQRMLDLFSTGRDPEWRNRLIWGDKKYVLPSLVDEFASKVDLIYVDPPFDTGADFSFEVQVDGEDFTKEPSVIEQKAYRDTWGRGMESYLHWLYETGVFLRELLCERGSLYIHLDARMVHYAKCVMDELFGSDQFLCQITWKRSSIRKASSKKWLSVDDLLLMYTKSSDFTFNVIHLPYSEEYKKRFNQQDEHGQYYWIDIGTYSEGRLNELVAAGRVRFPANPKAHPRIKHYLHEGKGVQPDNVWTDIIPVNSQAKEDTGYPTQKPEDLLKRIVEASSNEGDLVLDCFCGSGTTPAVAEKLGRRWIAADLGRFAIHTTRKRLLSIPRVRPFVVQNLGKYERQLWQSAEFGEKAEARALAYRRFILDLYRAQPLTGYVWLHGLKAGRLVHVGSVDAPISPGDVSQIATELKRMQGSGAGAPSTNGVDVLGWDFAFELNEVARQQAALAKVDVRFVRIPREVLEKRAVEQGDIRFFELAALSVDLAVTGRAATLTLTDFVIPLDDVPDDVRRAITNWAQWIDYWAVDWDNQGDAFHNQWQAYRTRQSRDLQKSTTHTYDQPGTYSVVVKVIDLLGNDTTKTLRVEVS